MSSPYISPFGTNNRRVYNPRTHTVCAMVAKGDGGPVGREGAAYLHWIWLLSKASQESSSETV